MVGRKVKLFCNFCSILYLSFFITVEFFRFLFFKPRKLYIYITFTLGFFIAGHMTETIFYLKFFGKPLANFPSFFL